MRWHHNHSSGAILRISDRKEIFWRNHWGQNFNTRFIVMLEIERQDFWFTVWKIGILNLCLCLGIERKKE